MAETLKSRLLIGHHVREDLFNLVGSLWHHKLQTIKVIANSLGIRGINTMRLLSSMNMAMGLGVVCALSTHENRYRERGAFR